MYETLAPGVADRTVTTQDLNIPDPPDGADPLTATGLPTAIVPAAPVAFSIPTPVALAPPAVVVLATVTSGASPSLLASTAPASPGMPPAIGAPEEKLVVGARPVQRLSDITAAGIRASWIDRTVDENRPPGLEDIAARDDVPREHGPALGPTTPIVANSLLRSWDDAIDAYVAEGDAPARSTEPVVQSLDRASDPAVSSLDSALLAGVAVALWASWEVRSRTDDRRKSVEKPREAAGTSSGNSDAIRT